MKGTKQEKKRIKNKIILRLGEILQDSDGILTLVKLNILFLFTALPFLPPVFIFTFGPSATALGYCANTLVYKGYLPDVRKTYMQIFRNNFKKSVLPGVITVCIFSVFSVSLYIYLSMASSSIIYIPLASVSMIVLCFTIGIGTHMFAEISKEEQHTVKEYFYNSLIYMMQHLPATMTAVTVAFVLLAVIILMLPATLPLLLTIAFSIPALAMAFAHTEPDFPV